jgi:hypothetical protein
LVQHAGTLEPGQIKSIADPRHPPASITGCVARLAPPETGVLDVSDPPASVEYRIVATSPEALEAFDQTRWILLRRANL